MSGDRVFFDTNIYLYVYSTADPLKQAQALALYREYGLEGRILVSTQVVQEFFVSAQRKLGLPARRVRDIALAMLDAPLITVGPPQIRAAIDNVERYQISFWDALILAAAESGGAETVFSEDLNDGQQYGPIQVRNPFRSPQNH